MRLAETHVPDDRLVELCAGQADRPGDREHLAVCAACAARHEEIARLLSDATAVATADADAVFTPERLARQRARILQRIEHDGAAGRVIAFPAAQIQTRPPRQRPGTRWIASAAAAGLLIGLVAGHFVHLWPVTSLETSRSALDRPQVAQSISTTISEDEFLLRLETALEGTNGVLRPLDDLTPRVWEVAAQ